VGLEFGQVSRIGLQQAAGGVAKGGFIADQALGARSVDDHWQVED